MVRRCRWRRAAGSEPGPESAAEHAQPANSDPPGRSWPRRSRTMPAFLVVPEPPVKPPLRALVAQAIDALRAAGTVPADAPLPEFVIERPKSRTQGDFSTNAAMLLAKHASQTGARANPRAVAQALVDALPANADIARVEIAGPGFINFHVNEAAWRRELGVVIARGADYGRNRSGAGHRVGVEYVSANPTGPLHVCHGS